MDAIQQNLPGSDTSLCGSTASEQLLLDLLLHTSSEALRASARQLLDHVGEASRPAHAWLVSLLLRGQRRAEAQPTHCADFYLMFAHAVTSLPTVHEVCYVSATLSK